MKRLFVTGNNTEVGKTVVSAVLTHATGADYWKPIQAGDLHNTDTDKVKRWVSHPKSKIHEEQFRLANPISPHEAARLDGTEIKTGDLQIPSTENNLIIEGAGGLFSPINNTETMCSIVERFKLPVILVVGHYLGSINHSLLTIRQMKALELNVLGIVFSGKGNAASEEVILANSPYPLLGRVSWMEEINQTEITKVSAQFTQLWD